MSSLLFHLRERAFLANSGAAWRGSRPGGGRPSTLPPCGRRRWW
ncbi:MAG: hypothetical protein U0802_07670 [Candidatus Binatia bacterium]